MANYNESFEEYFDFDEEYLKDMQPATAGVLIHKRKTHVKYVLNTVISILLVYLGITDKDTSVSLTFVKDYLKKIEIDTERIPDREQRLSRYQRFYELMMPYLDVMDQYAYDYIITKCTEQGIIP